PLGGDLPDLPGGPLRLRDGGDEDPADLPAVDRGGEVTHVVVVEVREHDRVEGLHPEPAEAPVDPAALGPDVDKHPPAGTGGEDEPVALPDVAGDDPPVRWRPGEAARGHRADGEDDDETEDEERTGAGAPQRPRPGEDPEGGEDGEQDGPGRTVRPGQGAARHVGADPGRPGDGDGEGG